MAAAAARAGRRIALLAAEAPRAPHLRRHQPCRARLNGRARRPWRQPSALSVRHQASAGCCQLREQKRTMATVVGMRCVQVTRATRTMFLSRPYTRGSRVDAEGGPSPPSAASSASASWKGSSRVACAHDCTSRRALSRTSSSYCVREQAGRARVRRARGARQGERQCECQRLAARLQRLGHDDAHDGVKQVLCGHHVVEGAATALEAGVQRLVGWPHPTGH